ncbi:hypothetical protein ON010_g18619 [Phytophthora cinnamomi]|nr:hypothetical protein ON010_g18619 [Phytophthora cinnamomi]
MIATGNSPQFSFCEKSTATMATTASRASENAATKAGLHPKLLAPISPSGDPLASVGVTASPTHSIAVEGAHPHLGLKLEAHRRWNASLPLGFLWSVERVEINVTRADEDGELVFVLEVFLNLPTSRLPISKPSSNEERAVAAAAACPTFRVERGFRDFEELRKSVSACPAARTCQAVRWRGQAEAGPAGLRQRLRLHGPTTRPEDGQAQMPSAAARADSAHRVPAKWRNVLKRQELII